MVFSTRSNHLNGLREQIKKAVDDLPPMPTVIIKIQRHLSDPNSNTGQIADLIETDQAIAVKVLKLANSAFYGLSGKVTSIQHATVILGYKTLGELITIAGFSGLMGKKLSGYGYNSDELWKHSLAVALGSKIIAEKKHPEATNELLTAGLIHDIGKIILDPYVFQKRKDFEILVNNGDLTFLEAEKQILGFDHAEIASEVCTKWKLPNLLTGAIKHHHSPSLSNGNNMAFILHLADYIAVLCGAGYDTDDVLYRLDEKTESSLKIYQKEISSIMSSVLDAMVKVEV
jgi:putative nucleotidyltransferase with HDIG domain